jgi:hypothetical protein
MRNLAKLLKDNHILGLTDVHLRKTGFAELAKPESK